MLPTPVGVDRRRSRRLRWPRSAPHARGGGPYEWLYIHRDGPCSPRPWGWTQSQRTTSPSCKCSPRPWGWTAWACMPHPTMPVLPTPVGVDREWAVNLARSPRAPHARGGGPSGHEIPPLTSSCSPRPWGWTGSGEPGPARPGVLPTPVGVDRTCSGFSSPRSCAPHARGGGPRLASDRAAYLTCSPRPWGWTVWPVERAWVERCSPRPWGWTGDTPVYRQIAAVLPRPWGWTGRNELVPVPRHVLPTPVGVDRTPSTPASTSPSAPHARGGGPDAEHARLNLAECSHARGGGPLLDDLRAVEDECSPRPWGWTVHASPAQAVPSVLPTPVGVDRSATIRRSLEPRAPHARGGGPDPSHESISVDWCSPRPWGGPASYLARLGRD